MRFLMRPVYLISILILFCCLNLTAQPTQTVRGKVVDEESQAPLLARLFGLGSHGLIFGVVDFGFIVGSAVGALVTGYIFDITGSYQIAFFICAILSVVGLILTLVLRPARKPGVPAHRVSA